MSETEKMYRNAHVYPRVYRDITKENFENKAFNFVDMCNEAFTAEKQLKLIVFFVRKGFKVSFDNYTEDFSLEGIQKSLAMAINDKWQDLTEEERKQIKEILE